VSSAFSTVFLMAVVIRSYLYTLLLVILAKAESSNPLTVFAPSAN